MCFITFDDYLMFFRPTPTSSSHSPPHNSSNCSSPPHIYDRPMSPAKSNLSNGSGKPFFKP